MARTSSPGISSRAICSVSAQVSLSSTIRTSLDILWQEPVPDLMQGDEVPRSVRIRLKLLPKSHDVSIDGSGVRERFVTPHRIQDHVARERPVRILQEESQQIVFRRSELYLLAF